MPDREGYLNDNEIMVAGEVWRVTSIDSTGYRLTAGLYACEEEPCDKQATVELSCPKDDPDGGGWTCLCEQHFEEWKARG